MVPEDEFDKGIAMNVMIGGYLVMPRKGAYAASSSAESRFSGVGRKAAGICKGAAWRACGEIGSIAEIWTAKIKVVC